MHGLKHRRTALAVIAATIMVAGMSWQAAADTVVPLAAPAPVKRVVSGNYAAGVDNGWVIYQNRAGATPSQPILNFFEQDQTGSLKLRTAGFGAGGAGYIFNTGGIVFAPCTPASGNRCTLSSNDGQTGIGLGFGQATTGGQGGAVGGWVSDSALIAHVTNPDGFTGSIAALAADTTNGAFAVGWDLNTTTFTNHAVLWKLNSAAQTYVPLAKIDLGTLGGATSQALEISHNAKYVVGIAYNATNKGRAVYALTTDTAWTDIGAAVATAGGVLKSVALIASDSGFIVGNAAVKRIVGGRKVTVKIGFVYNTANAAIKFFEVPGSHIIPLRVLNDGRVVGNLETVMTGAIKAYRPFLFDGTHVVDFGTMVLASTGQPAFGCRVTRPNNLGELAGSCIPNNATSYGVSGAAFYLDAASASPVFIDINHAMHVNADAAMPTLRPYTIGTATAIDDLHEITVMGVRIIGGNPNVTAFLVSKPGYNP